MENEKLRVLDLFSGIGGFSLGLERTGGFETAAFCEIEEFPRRVLAKHWPEVPCYHDVTKLTADILDRDGIGRIDVITGGFPCQDLSTAGKQAGLGEGTRSGLWSEIVRLIGEIRPRYVIVENVAALLSGPSSKRGGWFGRVLGDLAECGYDAEWENIPAAALGGDHPRERVWVVAYPNKIRFQGLWVGRDVSCAANKRFFEERLQFHKKNNHGLRCSFWTADAGRIYGKNNGLPDRPHRIAACGNAVDVRIPEFIGRTILQAEAEYDGH